MVKKVKKRETLTHDFSKKISMEDGQTLYADGFEKAFVGLARQFNNVLAVYNYKACIDVLMMRDGMSEDEAVDYMEFNVVGAWVGDHTPVFMVNETVGFEDEMAGRW
jgi:hypothetical protein